MSSKKKLAARKRKSTTSRKKSPTGRFTRFLRAFTVSVVTSFGATSCALNPQLREQVPVESMLSQLGLLGFAQIPPEVAAAGAKVQTQFKGCPQFFPDGKPPVVPAGPALRELCFSSFALLHSGQTKTPVFVAQRLNRQMLLQAQSVGRTDRFYADARLPSRERAELADYRGSGYSRGHMAPAADMYTPEAMAQSFSLANMVPQNQRHNSGPWSEIEQHTRKYVMRASGDVYVLTGPVFENSGKKIGAGRVVVPTHLYKVVYDAKTGRSWVHWQANNSEAKAGPPISYKEFVRRTGVQWLHMNR